MADWHNDIDELRAKHLTEYGLKLCARKQRDDALRELAALRAERDELRERCRVMTTEIALYEDRESAALEELANAKGLLRRVWKGVPGDCREHVTWTGMTDATCAEVRAAIGEVE